MGNAEQSSSKPLDPTDDLAVVAMKTTFSGWLRKANRGQAEAILFLKDCFDRDLRMISELAGCNNPQEVFGLNGAVARELVANYLAEGSRVFAQHRVEGRRRYWH